MLFRKNQSNLNSFQASLGPAMVVGTGACIVFYGSILLGPLNLTVLRRYCLGHPMAMATVEMFFIALALMASKCATVLQQLSANGKVESALDEIAIAQSENPQALLSSERTQWLDTLWQTQPPSVGNSWFGQRIQGILQRQLLRKNSGQLDADLRELAGNDAKQQLSSSRWIRLIIASIPVLGIVGSLLGVSSALLRADVSALATNTPEALRATITSLESACATTALGLVLALVAMLVHFAVNQMELKLLATMDSQTFEYLHHFLAESENAFPPFPTKTPLDVPTQAILSSVQQLVQTQAELWQKTIQAAHVHWQDLHSKASDSVQSALTASIAHAVSQQDQSLSAHAESIARIQSESVELIDTRLQQWQTTFSEQARAVHHQQREMFLQTELLNKLIEKHDAIREMEPPLQAMLERLTDIDRFHEAAVCLTEAVAILGTQMERYGYLGRQPIRRRAVEEPQTHSSTESESETDEGPVTYKLKRRAG